MKDDHVSTHELAKDCTPLGFHSTSPSSPHASSQQLGFWSPGARDVTLWESCGAELRRCRSQPIDSVTHRPSLTPLCLGHPIGAVRPRESGAACRVSPSQSPIERVLKENTSAGISAPPPQPLRLPLRHSFHLIFHNLRVMT